MEKSCYIHVVGNAPGDRIGHVTVGESGYRNTSWDNTSVPTADEVDALVTYLNKRLRVPDEVAASMLIGSMFGWNVPGAALAIRHFQTKSEISAQIPQNHYHILY